MTKQTLKEHHKTLKFYLIHSLPRLLIQGLVLNGTTTKFSPSWTTFGGGETFYKREKREIKNHC